MDLVSYKTSSSSESDEETEPTPKKWYELRNPFEIVANKGDIVEHWIGKHVGKKYVEAVTAVPGNSSTTGRGGDVDNYETVNMDMSDDDKGSSDREEKHHSPKRHKSEVQSSSSKYDRKESREDDRRKSSSKSSEKHKDDRRRDSSRDKYRKDRRDDRYRRDDRRRDDDRDDRDRRRDDYRRGDRFRDDRRDRRDRKYDRREDDRSEKRLSDRSRRNRSRSKSPQPSVKQPHFEPKSPPIPQQQADSLSAVLANTSSSSSAVNAYHAERKMAKLGSLGLTLTQSNTAILATPATSTTTTATKVGDVEIPSYYNPNAINVAKYADQIQKRKLLWSGKKTEPTTIQKTWGSATFSQDSDGKVASKFMRLMGIKDPIKPPGDTSSGDEDKQKKLFSTLDQQYEVARQTTHTMRGVGLGFSSQRPF